MSSMIPLVFAWVCGAGIFTCFRWLERLGADTLQVIVINYFVAASLGWHFAGGPAAFIQVWPNPWTIAASVAGVAFLYLFNLMAKASQTLGVTVTSVSAKLSMVLPVFVFLVFDPTDGLSWNKGLALILALPAIVCSSWKDRTHGLSWKQLTLPLIIFTGGGLIDLMFGWYSGPEYMTSDSDRLLFTTIPFTIAGILGTGWLFFRSPPPTTGLKLLPTVGIGMGLGFINLGSLYFLLEAYAQLPMDRSAITPVVNLGIVVLASGLATWFFKEHLNPINKLGLFLACVAIALLGF